MPEEGEEPLNSQEQLMEYVSRQARAPGPDVPSPRRGPPAGTAPGRAVPLGTLN